MTAYPPEWVIYDEIDYESFHLAPGADEGMGMAVLAKVDLEGHLTGFPYSEVKSIFIQNGKA
jgi:hypothetical protein